MGVIWGKDGVVKEGSTTIGKITNFNIKESVTPVDSTSMGDTAETHIAGSGIPKWSAEIEVHYDEADTGQGALAIGASLSVAFYPAGAITGKKYRHGTASVIARGHDQKMDGESVKAQLSLQGNGALTESTVP